jgi:SNF2 family DNA or RNA helicase
MINNHRRGVSCILGDEMGLGKTAQATAVMEHIRLIRGTTQPFLVIAPLTTLGHWKREIEAWTDMNVVSYEVRLRRLLVSLRLTRVERLRNHSLSHTDALNGSPHTYSSISLKHTHTHTYTLSVRPLNHLKRRARRRMEPTCLV